MDDCGCPESEEHSTKSALGLDFWHTTSPSRNLIFLRPTSVHSWNGAFAYCSANLRRISSLRDVLKTLFSTTLYGPSFTGLVTASTLTSSLFTRHLVTYLILANMTETSQSTNLFFAPMPAFTDPQVQPHNQYIPARPGLAVGTGLTILVVTILLDAAVIDLVIKRKRCSTRKGNRKPVILSKCRKSCALEGMELQVKELFLQVDRTERRLDKTFGFKCSTNRKGHDRSGSAG